MKPSNGRGSAWHCTKRPKYKVAQKTKNCLILRNKRKNQIKAEFASLNKKFGSYLRCRTIFKSKNWARIGSRSSVDTKKRIPKAQMSQPNQNCKCDILFSKVYEDPLLTKSLLRHIKILSHFQESYLIITSQSL